MMMRNLGIGLILLFILPIIKPQQPPPPVQNQGQYQQPPSPVQNQGQFQQPPPPVQNQGQYQQPPPPVQNQGQFQQPPPPVQNQGQFQQPPPPVQNQGQFQQPPPPVQNQGQFQQPPPPVQNQGQFQQPPPPVQNQGQFQQPPPPVQNQGQFQQPPPPVQNQGQFQQPPPPVQNQGQYQQPPPVQNQGNLNTPNQDKSSNTPSNESVPPKKKNFKKVQPIRKDPPPPPKQDGEIIRYPSAERFKPDMDPSNSFVMLTVLIKSSSRDCYFHQPITNFMVNFDVIRGGDLDIGLSIIDPDGDEIIHKNPQTNGDVRIDVPFVNRDRSYAICLDNRKASNDEKVVGLSMTLDIDFQNPSEDEKDIVEGIRAFNLPDSHDPDLPENIEHLESIENRIDSLNQKIRKIMISFNRLKHTNNLDTAVMKGNFARIQNWSVFQVSIMIFIAVIQIMVIRSLFEGGRLNPFGIFGLQSSLSTEKVQSQTAYRA